MPSAIAPVPDSTRNNVTGLIIPAATSLPSELIHSVFGSEFAETLEHLISSSNHVKGLDEDNSVPSTSQKSRSRIPVRQPKSTTNAAKHPKHNHSAGGKGTNKSGHKKGNSGSDGLSIAASVASASQKLPTPTPTQLLSRHIQVKLLDLIKSNTIVDHENLVKEGRLGPKIVKFDLSTHMGSFIMSSDRLALNSQTNFASIKANVCVFKGKWQYEVQLGTCGVMQIGWATASTKFTSERGVGDSMDSYGYDGNRMRKWNFTSATYSRDVWKGGDIIGCCIDLDNYKVEFFRNGVSLGVAFTDIHHGPGIVYFPAVSLAYAENITANFGAAPFLFPIPNYEPIQSSKTIEDTKSALLLTWLEKLLRIYPTNGSLASGPSDQSSKSVPAAIQNEKQTVVLITNEIFQHLEPNVHSAFVVEHTLLPFLARQLGLPDKISHRDATTHNPAPNNGNLHITLDLMWTYFEENVIKSILERVAMILMSYVKSNTFSMAYPYQVYSIQILIGLLGHRRTRRHFIHHLLFDKTKLTNFLYVRPIDEDVLQAVIATPWWPGKTADNAPEAVAHRNGCNVVQEKINHLESIQVDLLKVLMTNTDGTDKRPSSRSLFLRMFRNYLYETIRPGALIIHPISKPLCSFFRVLKTISVLWSSEMDGNHKKSSITELPELPDLPSSLYFDTTLDYFEFDRCGGSVNHLYKQYHTEVAAAMEIADYYTEPQRPTRTFLEEIMSMNSSTDDQSPEDGATHVDTPFPGLFTGLLRVGQEQQHTVSAPAIADHVPAAERRHNSQASAATAGSNPHPPLNQVPSMTNFQTHRAISNREVPPPMNGSNTGQHHEMATQIIAEFGNNGRNNTTSQFAGIFPNTLVFNFPPIASPGPSSSTNNEDDVVQASAAETDAGSDSVSYSLQSETSSITSFGEQRPNSQFPGGALIAETTSGHNMIIPMFAEFRNFITPNLAISLFPGGTNLFSGLGGFGFQRQLVRPENPHHDEIGRDKGTMDPATSLRELLDDTILIYTAGVARHIEKVVFLRTQILEYVTAVVEAKKKLSSSNLTSQQKLEIQKSIDLFTTKLDEQSRHLSWLKCAVFTMERQGLIVSLLTNLLASLKQASSQDQLFRFVPDSHFTILVQFTLLLLNQMHPTVSYETIPGYRKLFQEVAEFVALHFNDSRVVLPETKDTLAQALNKFICNRTMLTAIEDMPDSSQTSMMKALLRPYENRAWATSNWMLVRIWQGNGFGFRYLNCASARKPYKTRGQNEFGILTNLAPTPSSKLQMHATRILMEDQSLASSFIHSILNQLNWSFSEFIGQMQEINASVSHSERNYVDGRQLKVCCTCFELTVALLRVVEMVVTIAGPIVTDFSHENAQPLLERVAMLLTQVLNRVGCVSGTFGQIMELEMTGLECITYYAMLASVAGILVAIVKGELKVTNKANLPVTKTILLEPSLQLSSFDFLLGENQSAHQAFSLRNYVPEDITANEMTSLEATIKHLKTWSSTFQEEAESISDEDICTICYAYPKSTTFRPCGHRACRSCIIHHLMNRGECFFCKGVIEQVVADDGTIIHDIHQPKETTSDSDSTNTDGRITGSGVILPHRGTSSRHEPSTDQIP